MNILFLCVANSARSQMAEALAKSILGEDWTVQSAGSQPSGQVHPVAVEVMQEIGLDITNQSSKSVEDLPKSFMDQLNFAVTLCAEEVCPVIHSEAQKIHWAHPDPAAASPDQIKNSFRLIRDQIKEKLQAFKAKL